MTLNAENRAFNQACLEAHNRFRAMHASPALKLDSLLAEGAQQWAENLAATGKLAHSGSHEYGENLAYWGSTQPIHMDGKEIVDLWYQEQKNHDYRNPHYQPNSGHFTQVIWKGSKRCGFGQAYSPDRKTLYVVGRYEPPGNLDDDFEGNISPPIGTAVNMGTPNPSMPVPQPTGHTTVVRKITSSGPKTVTTTKTTKVTIVYSQQEKK